MSSLSRQRSVLFGPGRMRRWPSQRCSSSGPRCRAAAPPGTRLTLTRCVAALLDAGAMRRIYRPSVGPLSSGIVTSSDRPVSGLTRDLHRPPSASTRSTRPVSPDPLLSRLPRLRHLNRQRRLAVGLDAHVDLGRLCVLGDVGERFGNDVIGGHFGRLGQPSMDGEVEFDSHRGAAGQRIECRPEPSLGQDRRVNPREISCTSPHANQTIDDVDSASSAGAVRVAPLPPPCVARAPARSAVVGRRRADRVRNAAAPRRRRPRSGPETRSVQSGPGRWRSRSQPDRRSPQPAPRCRGAGVRVATSRRRPPPTAGRRRQWARPPPRAGPARGSVRQQNRERSRSCRFGRRGRCATPSPRCCRPRVKTAPKGIFVNPGSSLRAASSVAVPSDW